MRKSVCALLLTVLVLVPATGNAYVQTTSSVGAGLRWSSNCQTFYLNEIGSDDVEDFDRLRDDVKLSLEEWGKPDCTSLTAAYGGTTNFEITGHFKEKEPINLIVWREKKWPYTSRPVAYTAVTYDKDTGEIFDADIEMNGEDFSFTIDPEKEHWKMDVRNVLTHELGHAFGLDHPDVVEATMHWQASPGETCKRDLHEDDINGICKVYPAGSGETCLAVTPIYKFFDFAEVPEPPGDGAGGGGCSAGGGAPVYAAALVFMLLAGALTRVGRVRARGRRP